MKRHGNLWPQIVDFSNLLQAHRQAQKGKRFRENVLRFNYNLEQNLQRLQYQLIHKTYQPGTYRTFEIFEPKPRLISAAPYRDRVVHHALCNIIQPIFERTFISDSYANRLGFGTHKALKRFTDFARSNRYIFQADIQKYFPSIDHETLKTIIRRKIKCPDTLWLIDSIIDNSNEQILSIAHFSDDYLLTPLDRRRGLPIGNLTSQFFANVYLNGLDHLAREQLRCSKYVRYVDDFALFSDDPAELMAARKTIETYLDSIRLKIHPIKSQIFEIQRGANFLGFRVLPDRIRVRNDNLRRAKRRYQQLQLDYAQGNATLPDIIHCLQSWEAHLKFGNTWKIRQQIFSQLVFSKAV